MEFESRLPSATMRPYIKRYFWGRHAHPPQVQRIVPNGEMGLCFYRGCRVRYDGRQEVTSCLAGQSMRYHDITALGGIEVVGVHFTVLGACLFFPAPLDHYAEQMVPLEAVHDSRLLRLEEQVMEATDHHACWQLMDGYFEEALAVSSVDALNLRRLHRAISYGMSHLHEVRMAEVASEACLGERQFGRLFVSMVGMTPKEFLRLQRYHRTVADLKQTALGSTTLTEVAWRNGYYDYAHMSADFRKICGYAPMTLLRVSENDGDEVGWRI